VIYLYFIIDADSGLDYVELSNRLINEWTGRNKEVNGRGLSRYSSEGTE
jgi:hypothetical protein